MAAAPLAARVAARGWFVDIPTATIAAVAGVPARMVTLRGRPSQLAMPGCCANCGSPAGGWLRIEKVFRRDAGDDGVNYAVSAQGHCVVVE